VTGPAARGPRFAVIGAGVLGAALAVRLAVRGAAVTLLDAGVPGRATTRSSLAWCNANDKTPRDYFERNAEGMRAWAALAASLDGAAWHRPVGNLEWAVTESDRAELDRRMRRLARWGYPVRRVDRAAAAELEPGIRPPAEVSELAWFAEESYLLTEPLVDRLVDRAARLGVTVRTGRYGRVTGVERGALRTTAGPPVPADTVVCCAGRWTAEVLRCCGEPTPAPLLDWADPGSAAPGLVVRVGPDGAPAPRRMLHTPEVVLRPHGEAGVLHLEAPDAVVDLHTPERALRDWAAELLARAVRVVPGLAGARVLEYRVCVRPMPLDGYPVVGRLPNGCYLMVTHSGVTLGAHLAELAAAELIEGVSRPELAPYRPQRFAGRPG
jgi:glycine/D-amino acid oxidase-like deaminating enzyme